MSGLDAARADNDSMNTAATAINAEIIRFFNANSSFHCRYSNLYKEVMLFNRVMPLLTRNGVLHTDTPSIKPHFKPVMKPSINSVIS
jgi:hypothetical protein